MCWAVSTVVQILNSKGEMFLYQAAFHMKNSMQQALRFSLAGIHLTGVTEWHLQRREDQQVRNTICNAYEYA